MAGAIWSHKIDGGIELNDVVNFVTQVPQVQDIPDWDVKSVPIDGTYPTFIRADPSPGIYTFLIQMSSCTDPVYDSRLATLDAIFTIGVAHTHTFRVRGMGAAKSVVVIPRGRIINFKQRQVVYTCYVPVPVPA